MDVDLVDMEAYALAKVCKLEGIDFRCFKYITDNANDNAPSDWIDNCKKGAKLFDNRINDF
jgi:adenosylhomocysteine nucleosidase